MTMRPPFFTQLMTVCLAEGVLCMFFYYFFPLWKPIARTNANCTYARPFAHRLTSLACMHEILACSSDILHCFTAAELIVMNL